MRSKAVIVLLAGGAVAFGLVVMAGVAFVVLRTRKPERPPKPPYTGPPYVQGTNLLPNGDMNLGRQNWEFYGTVASVEGGNPRFRLLGDDTTGAAAFQVVRLPEPRPKYALVIARAKATRIPPDEMSGLPYLWGHFKGSDGNAITFLQDYNMILRNTPAEEWGIVWGTFDIPPDAVWLHLELGQALHANGTRVGNPADFDDAGIYLFDSQIDARDFAEQY